MEIHIYSQQTRKDNIWGELCDWSILTNCTEMFPEAPRASIFDTMKLNDLATVTLWLLLQISIKFNFCNNILWLHFWSFNKLLMYENWKLYFWSDFILMVSVYSVVCNSWLRQVLPKEVGYLWSYYGPSDRLSACSGPAYCEHGDAVFAQST